MRFRILGRVELVDAQGPVEIGAAKPRALLAMLLLRANAVVPTDRLVEDLWDGEPPRSATNTLQTYVHQLRRILPDDRLVTRAPGYALRVEPGELDATEFERGLRRAETDGLPAVERITVLREALGWWRGATLAEFADAAWARADVARLDALRVVAQETCIDLELAQGQFDLAIPELEALVAEHPLRERLWALLIRALYATGRQADALRAYNTLRATLVDELGIEPSAELVDLQLAVLNHDAALDERATTPTRAANVAGGPLDVPVPRRLVRAPGSVFVGRERERAVLLDALDQVATAGRRFVLLSGEPGIGKTTLVSEVAAAAAASGVAVLYGRSEEGLAVPFQPWRDVLSHLARHAPELIEPGLAVLAPLLGHDAAPSSSDPESERYRLYRTIVEVLARASTRAPLLVVLDDLHWADGPSIDLLCHLARADADVQMLVVGTFRDTDLAPDHPLTDGLALLHRERGIERLALPGLSGVDLLALLETLAGHEMDTEGLQLRDALLAETDGNPFFGTEIIRHLRELGAIYEDTATGRWVANTALREQGLPVSVREVIMQRVARLGDETRRVLGAASVIGRDFDLAVLAEVVDEGVDDLIDLLEPAVARAVVLDVGPGRFTFRHALIEHALYDGLSPTRRGRAHRAVAEVIEKRGGDDLRSRAGELARHWASAAAPDSNEKTLSYAEIAGDDAIDRLAPLEAVRWYSLALDRLAESAEHDGYRRARLLVGLGTARRHAGDPASRVTLLEAAAAADRIGDVGSLVRAVLANTRGWNSIYGGVDEERVAMLRRALDRLQDDRSILRARLLTILCNETYYASSLDVRLALSEEAVAIARRAGEREALPEILTRTCESIAMPRTLELRVRWAAEAVEILDEHEGPWLVRRAGHYLASCTTGLENADGVGLRRAAARAHARVSENNLPIDVWNLTFHFVWLAALDGDIELAEQRAETALALGDAAGQLDALTVYSAQLVSIRWLQGRLPELVDVIADFAASNPGLDVYRAVDCWVSAISGRAEDVRARLDREVRDGFPAFEDQHWMTAHALWAHAAAIVGHREAAAWLRERIVPWSRQCVTTHITFGGAVAQYVAMVDHAFGDLDSAHHYFAEALELHERLQSPVLVAWTRAAWANLLDDRDRGDDRSRALVLREEALDAARGRDWGLVEQTAAATAR